MLNFAVFTFYFLIGKTVKALFVDLFVCLFLANFPLFNFSHLVFIFHYTLCFVIFLLLFMILEGWLLILYVMILPWSFLFRFNFSVYFLYYLLSSFTVNCFYILFHILFKMSCIISIHIFVTEILYSFVFYMRGNIPVNGCVKAERVLFVLHEF